MKCKKMISCVLATTMAFSLTACGSNAEEKEPDKSAAVSEQADQGEKAEVDESKIEYDLKMASAASADMYPNVAMQRGCDEVFEKTGGKVRITLYADNLLGDYTTCFEDLMKGTLDMSMFSSPADYDPRLGISTMPYLFTSWDQYEKVCYPGGALYNVMEKYLAEDNIKFLGFCTEGLQGLGMTGCSKLEDVINPDVRKDELMRVPPLDEFAKMAEALGFNYTSLPYADLYSSLQSGICEGWFGGAATINYTAYRDIIKVWVDARTSSEMMCINMNMDLWKSLPKEYQDIIEEAFRNASMWSFEQAESEEEKHKKLLEEYGVQIYVPSDEDLEKAANAVREAVWPSLRELHGDEVIDEIVSAVEG